MSEPPNLRVVHDAAAAAEAAAKLFKETGVEAVKARGRFTVSLGGGRTPRAFYELLASHTGSDPDLRKLWENTHLFLGDERFVPRDHPDSNFRMISETLLGRIEIPAENVHPVSTEAGDPDRAALLYEKELAELFGEGARPVFDLVYLGMGPDGHTASLFPYTDALRETDRSVVSNPVPRLDTVRITMTYPLLNAARRIVFVITGRDKSDTLAEVLCGKKDPERLPSQGISPSNGELTWILDRAAASRLPDRTAFFGTK